MLKKGFTLVEMLLIMGIFALLISIGSINYFSTINQTSSGTTKDVLIADLRSAQNRAMSGLSVAGVSVPSWGIKFLDTSYVIFPGPTFSAGAAGNYVVNLPERVVLTTTFPDNQIIFAKGSGEIISYNQNADTLSITVGTSSDNLELNNYGIVNDL